RSGRIGRDGRVHNSEDPWSVSSHPLFPPTLHSPRYTFPAPLPPYIAPPDIPPPSHLILSGKSWLLSGIQVEDWTGVLMATYLRKMGASFRSLRERRTGIAC
ncbi:unnamed protein product, partial [Discosporangium mesarthrocarpum]